MKAITTFALMLVWSLTNAQLTVSDLISKANCTDKDCFDSFILSKRYTSVSNGMATMANAYHYQAIATDCPGKNTNVLVGIAAKAYGYSIIIKCPATLVSYMADFDANGFKAVSDSNIITVSGNTYASGKYTSTAHPGVAMYLSEGKYSAAGTYTIKFQAE